MYFKCYFKLSALKTISAAGMYMFLNRSRETGIWCKRKKVLHTIKQFPPFSLTLLNSLCSLASMPMAGDLAAVFQAAWERNDDSWEAEIWESVFGVCLGKEWRGIFMDSKKPEMYLTQESLSNQESSYWRLDWLREILIGCRAFCFLPPVWIQSWLGTTTC